MQTKAKIVIQNPCYEKINNIARTDFGFYCDVCQKNVIDFTKYTDEELSSYYKLNKTKGVCGVYAKHQITNARELKPSFWTQLYSKAAIFITAILSSNFLLAQKDSVKVEINDQGSTHLQKINSEKIDSISGTVVSAEDWKPGGVRAGEILIGVTVSIKGTMKGAAVTDFDGNFNIKLDSNSSDLDNTVIVFAYLGFETVELNYHQFIKSEKNVIKLCPKSVLDEEFIVIGYGLKKNNNLNCLPIQKSDKTSISNILNFKLFFKRRFF
ncbi:MAG: carboxypeptidase-like regulatory domain-containing protein [Bacteroidota bacterium]|nr:carboxypeptidase-like regulatory domain-containing protein [Bacteroidota bacterium]